MRPTTPRRLISTASIGVGISRLSAKLNAKTAAIGEMQPHWDGVAYLNRIDRFTQHQMVAPWRKADFAMCRQRQSSQHLHPAGTALGLALVQHRHSITRAVHRHQLHRLIAGIVQPQITACRQTRRHQTQPAIIRPDLIGLGGSSLPHRAETQNGQPRQEK
ncbi:hypothetical protein RF55_21522 [Lasius niger]|uniref:Uncharacterized protein n=1 Tax=Lasius niger TaxID=67767 RepID=A0A0J7JXY8_LASNI|nr:hypothetical protein RF55_21522 [Lasius niger]